MTTVDELAQIIRQVDGNHSLGAAALAEAIIAKLPHIAARQPVVEPVAWQSMATCPRDGTAVLLRWGEDHVSPGWWCAAVSPIQNEDGTWPRETGGFPWAFFDMNDGVAFVNHAVDTEYGPTHWAPYVYPAAQAVDLATVRYALDAAEGLAVACASVDGFSREEIASAGREMRKQFADARALIDGQRWANEQ